MHFLIPSLGLSDIIHISVIIWNKIANRFRSKPKIIKSNKPSIIMSFLGGMVIIIVTLITFSSAISIVYISATEKHSMIHLAINIMNDKNIPENKINEAIAATVVCNNAINQENIETTAIKTDSIIDYLEANNQDSSFENRRVIANKYGISEYYGDEEQNIELISKINKDLAFDKNLCIVK